VCAYRSSARRVGFVGSLVAVAMRWDAVVDRREVRRVVGAASERGDDVVDRVSSGLLADVAGASVASQDAGAESPPVRRQGCTAVPAHAAIVSSSDAAT
jgi:hypothetical protein